MNSVVRVLRPRTPGGHVAVPKNGQCFTVALMGRIETVICQHPGVDAGHPEVKLSDVTKDDVSTRGFELIRVPCPVNADHQSEPAPARGLDAGGGIFDDCRMAGFGPQPARRFEKQRRIRFARQGLIGGNLAVDDDVELPNQTRLGQQCAGVAARGDQANGNPCRVQPGQHRYRPRIGAHALALRRRKEQGVLAGSQSVDRPNVGSVVGPARGNLSSAGGQEGHDPVLALTSIDVQPIVGVDIERVPSWMPFETGVLKDVVE